MDDDAEVGAALLRLVEEGHSSAEIEASLSADVLELEESTVGWLLTWAPSKRGGGGANEEGDGAAAKTALGSALDTLDSELVSMERWLDGHGAEIKKMGEAMAAVDRADVELEAEHASLVKLEATLGALLAALQLPEAQAAVLADPAAVLGSPLLPGGGGAAVAGAADEVRAAALALKRVAAAADGQFPGEAGRRRRYVPKLAAARGAARDMRALADDCGVEVAAWLQRSLTNVLARPAAGLDKTAAEVTALEAAQGRYHAVLRPALPLVPALRTLARCGCGPLGGAAAAARARMRAAHAEQSADRLFHPHIKAYFRALLARTSAAVGDDDELSPSAAIAKALADFVPIVDAEARFLQRVHGGDGEDGGDGGAEDGGAEDGSDHDDDDEWDGPADALAVQFKKFEAKLETLADMTVGVDALAAILHLQGVQRERRRTNAAGAAVANTADAAAYVGRLLEGATDKVRARWQAFVAKEVDAIASATGDIKQAGVLPAVARFCGLASAVSERARAAEGRDEGGDVAAASQRLGEALFVWVEGRAATNDKYKDVFLYENYTSFAALSYGGGDDGDGGQGGGEGEGAPFAQFADDAAEKAEAAKGRYVRWMLRYAWPPLFEFWDRAEALFEEYGAAEVPIREPKANLTKAMAGHRKRDMAGGLGRVRKRLDKHLGGKGELRGPAWDALAAELRARWAKWREIAAECYEVELEELEV